MNNCKTAGLVLAGIAFAATAQAQKKMFTMAEATSGLATTLAPKSIKGATWQPGTDNFWMVDKDSSNKWDCISLTTKGAKMATQDPGDYPGKTAKSNLPALKWLNKDEAYYVNKQDVVVGKTDGNKWTWNTWFTLPASAENITVDKSKKIAWTVDNNLWLRDVATKQVTNETDKNIVCGKSVHRDEFGIDQGIFFSPKGTLLAYYRMDQTMVRDYPIPHWDTVPAIIEQIKYPMAGGASHEVTLCIFDPATSKTVVVKTNDGEKDHYLTSVTWSPDEAFIFIAILNRDQNHLWLNKYDAKTGDLVKTLFEESSPKYVHPTHSLTFIPGKNDQFLWWTERDGYDHLYLYSTDGKLIRQVTKGNWLVNDIAGFDTKNKQVIITASRESPMEKHIYTADLETGKVTRIDKDPGMHTALASEDGKYVYDVYTGPGIPKNSVIRATSGTFSESLLRSPDPLAAYERAQVKNVTMTLNIDKPDAIQLYGKLILPPNFDSAKKYPVMVYLYNGPNVQLLHNTFPESGNLWYEYMAQHGYIVFTMDGRGSSNRGLAFEQATFRHLGEIEIEDQLRGVDYLKSLPYVDANRLGIHGWSYGGFMTTSLMLKHPGVFKCAVAGGPVMDWKMYEVMYTERYMDMPQNNAEGYAKANLLDKVKNLKGKLMLIHGTNDNVVVWQHSLDFLKKSVDEGVQVDYFVYPGYEHNVRGKDRVHLMQKITDYFDQNLK